MKPFLPLSLLVFAAGCRTAPPAYVPVPPPKVEAVSLDVSGGDAVMPMAVGNRWSYTMRTQVIQNGQPGPNNDQEVAYRVESSVGGTAHLILETSDGKSAIDAQDWRATADGVYQVATGLSGAPTVPPQPLVLLPLEEGHRFGWRGKAMMPDGSNSEGKAESTILAPQTVDTAMGPMSAVPVESRMKFASGTSDSTAWFRPGVGLVRYFQSTTSKGKTITLLLLLTNTTLLKRP